MTWYLWLIIGAAVGIAGLFAVVGVLNYFDGRASKRRLAISQERSTAERQMQTIVQDTISQMFAAARNPFQ